MYFRPGFPKYVSDLLVDEVGERTELCPEVVELNRT